MATEFLGKHIKAVLFDHDDTLIGTIGSRWEHHKYVARTFYHKELTDKEIIEHWGKPFAKLVCLLYETDNATEALARNNASRDQYPEPLFDGVIPVLQKFKETGRLTGIVTAASRSDFEQDLDRLHIPRKLVDYTQTADDTPYHKPDHRVFEPALKWLAEHDIKPSEVVYVGDGLHDMKAALNTGFNFVGVETGLVTAKQFKKAGAVSIPRVDALFG